jgi:hypothetical protein
MDNAHQKKIEACSRAAHEVNRAYCIAIGDDSQLPWESAPQWQRDSSMRGIEAALAGSTPEQQHEAWRNDKIAHGWVWGREKNAEDKTHPCIVSYADLPPEQKKKDDLYVGTVRGMAAALGMVVSYPASQERDAVDDLPAMPAWPARTIDWSKQA